MNSFFKNEQNLIVCIMNNFKKFRNKKTRVQLLKIIINSSIECLLLKYINIYLSNFFSEK